MRRRQACIAEYGGGQCHARESICCALAVWPQSCQSCIAYRCFSCTQQNLTATTHKTRQRHDFVTGCRIHACEVRLLELLIDLCAEHSKSLRPHFRSGGSGGEGVVISNGGGGGRKSQHLRMKSYFGLITNLHCTMLPVLCCMLKLMSYP